MTQNLMNCKQHLVGSNTLARKGLAFISEIPFPYTPSSTFTRTPFPLTRGPTQSWNSNAYTGNVRINLDGQLWILVNNEKFINPTKVRGRVNG